MIKKKSIFAVVAIVCCVVAVVGLITMGKGSSTGVNYKEEIKLAEEYKEKKLYYKSCNKYSSALQEKDTEKIRLAQLEVIKLGIETGEFNNSTYETYLKQYKSEYFKSSTPYELALDYYYALEDYETCISIIDEGMEYGVSTKITKDYRDKISRKYTLMHVNYNEATPFRNHLTAVKYDDSYGVIDDSGKIYADISFDYASPFFYSTENEDETRLWGFFKQGEYVYLANSNLIRQQYLPSEIESSTGVGSGLLSCKIGDKYCYYNLDGEPVMNNKQFDYASKFMTDIAAVCEGNAWYFINTKGEKILSTGFNHIKLNGFDECVKKQTVYAKKDSASGYTAYKYADGKLTETKVVVDDVDLPPNGNCTMIAYREGDLWGYMDTDLKTVIKPQYEEAKSFSNGLAGVKKDGKWTVINENNESVLDVEDDVTEIGYFDSVTFGNGKTGNFCFVRINGNWQIMKLYLV